MHRGFAKLSIGNDVVCSLVHGHDRDRYGAGIHSSICNIHVLYLYVFIASLSLCSDVACVQVALYARPACMGGSRGGAGGSCPLCPGPTTPAAPQS